MSSFLHQLLRLSEYLGFSILLYYKDPNRTQITGHTLLVNLVSFHLHKVSTCVVKVQLPQTHTPQTPPFFTPAVMVMMSPLQGVDETSRRIPD